MFEVETIYDKETLIAFQTLIDNTIRAKRKNFKRWLALALGIIGLVLGIMWVSIGQAVPAVSAFIMAAAFLAVAIFFQKYSMLGKKHEVNQDVHNIRYTFAKDGYTTHDKYGYHKSPYTAIKYICESDYCYALMLDKRRGFVLKKKGFIKGTAEEFRHFIEGKTGLKTMRPVE